ncbi:hypothetical protein Tsubulata_034414 [Turnera subulata]|uniref:E2F/DP family winged-helix DNA-binding domain-containing protein n=1 Tax=Turnera subulata TaxID=218843 RepID=A0A9Q0GGX4_9ROSI|nr:hypothetical protein Tsubulata_034414 [Turnera subulata]
MSFLSLYDRQDNDVWRDGGSMILLMFWRVLNRRAKNQYSWRGFQAIPKALQGLKEEGFKENPNAPDKGTDSAVKDLDDYDENEEDDDSDSNPNTGSQNDNSVPGGTAKSAAGSRFDNRKEKSLGLLTRNFVKLFVCSDSELISLDEAAKLLLGDGHNASIMKTKVRRIYDIANVLSSLKLIEKTHTADSRKPAFRWFGVGGKSSNLSRSTFGMKREFGADITNTCFKRNKMDSSAVGDQSQNLKMLGTCSSGYDPPQGSKSYQFGPFAPANFPKSGGPEKEVPEKHDWEKLASTYRPRYHNQVLRCTSIG